MLIDYHVHNHFSPDSEEDNQKIMQQALKLGMDEICITNHPELYDEKTGKDFFDQNEATKRFKKIKAELDEVQKKYPNKNPIKTLGIFFAIFFRRKSTKISP